MVIIIDYKTMSYLSDLFKKIPTSQVNPFTPGFDYSNQTRTLPNGAGSYSSPTLLTKSVAPTPVTPAIPKTLVTPTAPKSLFSAPNTASAAPVAPAPVKSKYINPATGAYYTPEEYANSVAMKIPVSKANGDIGQYAGDAITNPNQTTQELNRSAYGMNNTRNDISTGQTDPYDITKGGTIVYSPTERAAIEKAYAGIYDPALSDVFTKLDAKSKQEAADLAQKNKLAEMAQQHAYNMQEKGITGGGTSSGTYVPGDNQTVDSWAERIQNGSAKITDIPASQAGLRNQVTVALNAMGNSTDGKPTTTELGKAALANAKALMQKFNDRTGTYAVGSSRFWGGAAAGNIPGTDSYNFANDFNAIKSQLSLEAVKFLKGQGQVSDAERALLAQAATKLNLSQSEDEFKKTLQGIIDKLEGNNVSSSITTAAPDGSGDTIVITD